MGMGFLIPDQVEAEGLWHRERSSAARTFELGGLLSLIAAAGPTRLAVVILAVLPHGLIYDRTSREASYSHYLRDRANRAMSDSRHYHIMS